jgi:succinate dehydrogenase flavin-adding protein (antitoxin of CptAB toxin-antitoxin module)
MTDIFVFPYESLKAVGYPKITNAEIIFILTITIPIGDHPDADSPMEEKMRFLDMYMPLEFQKIQYMKTIDKALDILKYSLYSREDNVLLELANKINDKYEIKKLVDKIRDTECTKDINNIKVTLTEARRYIYPDLSLSKYASAQAKQLNIRKYEYYARIFQCYVDQDKDLDMLTLYRVSNTVYNYIRLNNLFNIIKRTRFKTDKIEQLVEKIKQRVNTTLEAMAEKKIIETNENLLNSITIKIKEIDLG